MTVKTSKGLAKTPIKAYGPNNIIIAESEDGGRTWVKTREGAELEKKHATTPRTFTRRIAAVADDMGPSFQRRIGAPFSILHEANIMPGWADGNTIAALEDEALDAVILPGTGFTPEDVSRFRRVSKKIILDVDAMTRLAANREELDALLPLVDAVIVPSDLMASRLRPYHHHVFVIPDLLLTELWTGKSRQIVPGKGHVTVGLPPQLPPSIAAAVEHLTEKHGNRVRWQTIDWASIDPKDEPDVYLKLDLVILPAPEERHMTPLAALLPPMAAGCAVIADRLWPMIRHEVTGWHVGRDNAINWTTTINKGILDSHRRIMIGRQAAASARRWTPRTKFNQIVLPYRMVVPQSTPVTYVGA